VGEDGPRTSRSSICSRCAHSRPDRAAPGDANEVAEAWRVIMKLKHEAGGLILSRQNMPTLDRTKYASGSGVAKGAYVLADARTASPK
jgi:transketolase